MMWVKLSAALIQELWLLVILGPLCASDMRAQSIPEVFLTDASQDKMASVRADLPSAEFQRHCLARGYLESPPQPLEDVAAASWLTAGRRRVTWWGTTSEPPLVAFDFAGTAVSSESLQDGKKPAPHQPAWTWGSFGARREALQATWQRSLCVPSDSQVTLAALVKGRSSSYRLNKMLQSSLATYLGCGMYGITCKRKWRPTRDAKIRDSWMLGRSLQRQFRAFWWVAGCSGFSP